jgi:hypothetical protein
VSDGLWREDNRAYIHGPSLLSGEGSGGRNVGRPKGGSGPKHGESEFGLLSTATLEEV